MSSGRFPAAVFVLVLTTASVAGPSVALAQETQVTLEITVVDQNGDPVGAVPLSATWDDGAGGPVNETTRSNGQALLDVPAGADVTIRVDDDEYVRNEPYVVADADGQSVEVSVSESATATVSVVNAAGQPVENARVRLYRSRLYVTEQRTGANGTVTTPPVESGEYSVIVDKDGFFRNVTRLAVTDQNNTTVSIEQGSALVTVSVTDDNFATPRPLQNATVRVPSVGTVQTLSNGEATISVPVNSDYDLAVSKAGYQSLTERISVGESDTRVGLSIQRTPRIDLTSENQRVVVGQTVRLTATDEYGDPVEDANVTQNGTVVGRTDTEGIALISVDTTGTVSYTATDGTESGTTSIEVVDPDATATTTATATQTATPSGTATPTSSDGAGFTAVTALTALAALAVLVARRR